MYVFTGNGSLFLSAFVKKVGSLNLPLPAPDDKGKQSQQQAQ
jgi:hypothetical protein